MNCHFAKEQNFRKFHINNRMFRRFVVLYSKVRNSLGSDHCISHHIRHFNSIGNRNAINAQIVITLHTVEDSNGQSERMPTALVEIFKRLFIAV